MFACAVIKPVCYLNNLPVFAVFIVDKVFSESFDEVEKFLVNRLVRPEYTAVFQVPQQNEFGQTYTEYQQVTWPKQGPWHPNW
mgnify:CR=1 FL=1